MHTLFKNIAQHYIVNLWKNDKSASTFLALAGLVMFKHRPQVFTTSHSSFSGVKNILPLKSKQVTTKATFISPCYWQTPKQSTQHSPKSVSQGHQAIRGL